MTLHQIHYCLITQVFQALRDHQSKIKCIDFLKVDVEGYEYEVLKGAKEIIKNVKFIMLEVQKNDMYANYSKNKIENFLKKNNFILIKSFDFPLMFFKDCIYKKIED